MNNVYESLHGLEFPAYIILLQYFSGSRDPSKIPVPRDSHSLYAGELLRSLI
jgi:hypothetical protein